MKTEGKKTEHSGREELFWMWGCPNHLDSGGIGECLEHNNTCDTRSSVPRSTCDATLEPFPFSYEIMTCEGDPYNPISSIHLGYEHLQHEQQQIKSTVMIRPSHSYPS